MFFLASVEYRAFKLQDELDENEGVNVHFDESDEEQDAVIDEIKSKLRYFFFSKICF